MGRRWLVLVTAGACVIGSGGCGRELGRSLSANGAGVEGSVLPPIRPVSPAACSGGLALASALTLSPVPAGRLFTRCATLGPDMRWAPTLSPDGSRLAARTPTGTVRLLDTASWREVAQLASPIGRMDALAFSPDGRQLATLTQETGILALWRSEDGAFLQSFAGSPASTVDTTATQVAFSSDGKQLMSSLGTRVALDGANTPDGGGDSDAFLMLFGGGTTPQLRFVGGDQRVFRDLRYAVGNSPGSVRLSVLDLPTRFANDALRTVRSRSARARRLG